jgi:GAF domain-containing protein
MHRPDVAACDRPESTGMETHGPDRGVTPPDAAATGESPRQPAAAVLAHRLERLHEISIALTRATTSAQVVDIVMEVLDLESVSGYRSRCLWMRSPTHGDLELVAHAGMPEESIEQFARIDIGAALPVAVAMREARTVTSESRSAAAREYEDLQGALRITERFLAVPLVVEDRSVGVFSVGFDGEPDPAEVLFLEAIAGQAAPTLGRVRLAERDRRRRAELELLADLSDAALSARDHRELMRNVTSTAVPMLGDWCSIHFAPADGGPMQIELAHVDPERIDWARALLDRYPYDPEADTAIATVIRTGTTHFVPLVDQRHIDDAIARSPIEDADLASIMEKLQLTSVITVPLRSRRGIIGAMQFVSAESDRRYDLDDVALAGAVAGRLAEPLDGAWLNDQQRAIAVTLQRALLPPRLPVIDRVQLAVRYFPPG